MRVVLLILLMAALQPSMAKAMSVEQAYQAIPHKQTTYNYADSPLDEHKRIYLSNLFALVDYAVILRVELLQKMYHGAAYDLSSYKESYGIIFEQLEELETPSDLQKAQLLVEAAVKEHLQFFVEWDQARGKAQKKYKNYGSHALARNSSKKLIQAYQVYMKLYPQETKHNKTAFFDHLCALDFL